MKCGAGKVILFATPGSAPQRVLRGLAYRFNTHIYFSSALLAIDGCAVRAGC